MSEKNETNEEKTINEEVEKEEKLEDEAAELKEEPTKAKFTFKCTRCDDCCLSRGPIPITFYDLEMW
ncbi:MAG: hypothetical protein ACFFD1_13880, partial [Candidatus Thorarchaeota archaeon]